jgi:CheY-like chemotaxis protein
MTTDMLTRNAQQARILFVEDNPDTALAVRMLLERRGYSVGVAHFYSTALELSNHEDFDLLICDIMLPDGSGWELIGALREQRRLMPGIALSALTSPEDIERSREAGFSRHITKPILTLELYSAIEELLAAGRGSN